ncbi:DNA polymerase III subunit beta [bacterium]|nr:DNA polymerase III subunit beta [Treponema sp.]MBR1374401.1 DNA polymerase III subunit beta [bacterium]
MKFTFDRDALLKEIAIAQEIITNKSPLSILSNIYLRAENNALVIKASDSSLNFTTRIPVDVVEDGDTTIFCDKFMSILSAVPDGEIEFDKEDIKVTIKPRAKKIRFQLKSIASDKFPDIVPAVDAPFFEIPAKEFKEMIMQTIFAVSEDAQRFFMTGVYFTKDGDNLTMVATDGRRLSYISKPIAQSIADFPAAIVPTKILNCVLKHASDEGNIFVALVDKIIFIKFGSYEFSSLLLDGQFPNYQKVIPEKQAYLFQVNKIDLEAALKRTTIMIDKKVSRLLFKISADTLTLVSPESDIGTASEEIPCQYDGEDITIALNYMYVLDPLKVIDAETIAIEFTEAMKAITLRPEPQKDYFHIIMPMNLN